MSRPRGACDQKKGEDKTGTPVHDKEAMARGPARMKLERLPSGFYCVLVLLLSEYLLSEKVRWERDPQNNGVCFPFGTADGAVDEDSAELIMKRYVAHRAETQRSGVRITFLPNKHFEAHTQLRRDPEYTEQFLCGLVRGGVCTAKALDTAVWLFGWQEGVRNSEWAAAGEKFRTELREKSKITDKHRSMQQSLNRIAVVEDHRSSDDTVRLLQAAQEDTDELVDLRIEALLKMFGLVGEGPVYHSVKYESDDVNDFYRRSGPGVYIRRLIQTTPPETEMDKMMIARKREIVGHTQLILHRDGGPSYIYEPNRGFMTAEEWNARQKVRPSGLNEWIDAGVSVHIRKIRKGEDCGEPPCII